MEQKHFTVRVPEVTKYHHASIYKGRTPDASSERLKYGIFLPVEAVRDAGAWHPGFHVRHANPDWPGTFDAVWATSPKPVPVGVPFGSESTFVKVLEFMEATNRGRDAIFLGEMIDADVELFFAYDRPVLAIREIHIRPDIGEGE